jgi:hypothetical protein
MHYRGEACLVWPQLLWPELLSETWSPKAAFPRSEKAQLDGHESVSVTHGHWVEVSRGPMGIGEPETRKQASAGGYVLANSGRCPCCAVEPE